MEDRTDADSFESIGSVVQRVLAKAAARRTEARMKEVRRQRARRLTPWTKTTATRVNGRTDT